MRTSFAAHIRLLKKELPCFFPVAIRRLKLPSHRLGDCDFDEEEQKFLIRVNNALPHYVQKDILYHEYAHALAWAPGHMTTTIHTASWGVAYARTVRLSNGEDSPRRDDVAAHIKFQ